MSLNITQCHPDGMGDRITPRGEPLSQTPKTAGIPTSQPRVRWREDLTTGPKSISILCFRRSPHLLEVEIRLNRSLKFSSSHIEKQNRTGGIHKIK